MENGVTVVESQPTDISTFSDSQLHDWKLTGKVPEAKPAEKPSAESAPAAENEETPKEEIESGAAAASGAEAGKKGSDSGAEQEQGKNGSERPSYGPKAEKRIKQLLSENKALKEQLSKKEPPATRAPETPAAAAPPATEEKEPTAEDRDKDGNPKFKTWKEYEDARVAWRVEQEKKGQVKAQAEAAAKEKQEAAVKSFQGRVEEAKKKYNDFETKAFNKDLPIPANGVVDVFILRSKYGPDVLYALANNVEQLKALNELGKSDPLEAWDILKELEREFVVAKPKEEPGTPPARRVSGAPPPATEVGGRGASPADAVEKAVANKDFTTYQAEQNRREIAKRKG